MADQVLRFSGPAGETLTVVAVSVAALGTTFTAESVDEVRGGLYEADFGSANLSAGLYHFEAFSGAVFVGRGMVRLASGAGTYREIVEAEASVDIDEDAIADAVVAQLEGGSVTIVTTGPVLTDGDPLKIVQGDDYQNATVDRRVSVTLTGSGLGSLTSDTWTLRLNTRGAEPIEVAGSASTVDASTLRIKFPVTAEESLTLKATQGEWSVRRAPQSTVVAFDVIRGPLIVSRDLSIQRT